jgi:Ca-activated chloride channel family protein
MIKSKKFSLMITFVFILVLGIAAFFLLVPKMAGTRGYSINKKNMSGEMRYSSNDSPRYAAAPEEVNRNIDETKTNGQYQSVNKSDFNTEDYKKIDDNPFLDSMKNPLSTFSIDVDTASYSNIRRFINSKENPPEDAVRIEEMINYFDYDYPEPKDKVPFSINTELGKCPWNANHNLLLIGLQGKKLKIQNTPPNNLVFLIDASGSMEEYNKLPLLKSALKLLVGELRAKDRISIVTYSGSAGLLLDSTPGNEKKKIINAIEGIEADGSTAGAEGIEFAYKIAEKNIIKSGNNRVILSTDGDFNVGVSSDGDLTRLIEEKRKTGVFLTVLGFGMGNYKDSKIETLADKGNGNYAYIDNLTEAKKVLVKEIGSTITTIAKDVKVQMEFNPAKIKGYRLIGYENRMLNSEDFNDDKKDAGELGAGHCVTALYEIIPANSKENASNVDKLKYQKSYINPSKDLSTIKLRYKEPKSDISKLLTQTVSEENFKNTTTDNFNFAASVAEFGMLLRNSEYKANSSYENVLQLARNAKGKDEEGYRAEFIKIVEAAEKLEKSK